MICLGPICLPVIPLFIILLKPLWSVLPDRVKRFFSSVWMYIRDLLIGKKHKVRKEHKPDEDEVVRHLVDVADLNQAPIAIVDFGAAWCGPCKRISPLFHQLATKHKGKAIFYQCDIDEQPDIAESQRIASVPAFKVYRKGQGVAGFIGADSDKLSKLFSDFC